MHKHCPGYAAKMARTGSAVQDWHEVFEESKQREHAVLLQRYWIKINYRIPKPDILDVNEILALSWVHSGNVVSTFVDLHPVG